MIGNRCQWNIFWQQNDSIDKFDNKLDDKQGKIFYTFLGKTQSKLASLVFFGFIAFEGQRKMFVLQSNS